MEPKMMIQNAAWPGTSDAARAFLTTLGLVCGRRAVLLGLCLTLFPATPVHAEDPAVGMVRPHQLDDSIVQVRYRLAGAPPEGATVTVTFEYQQTTITPSAEALSGDVGAGIEDGNRLILWNAAADLPDGFYTDEMVATVTATEQEFSGETLTVMLPGGVPLELVYIPPGTFMMGSPPDERGRSDDETLHEVTLTRGYYLGKYEVTQEQWVALMDYNPSFFKHGGRYPVEMVFWEQTCGGLTGADCVANSFIGRLNRYLGTDAFRLPTEAEWERAARAGTQTRFSHGDVLDSTDDYCSGSTVHERFMWYCYNSGGTTHPVGTKVRNSFGLYDMHGNVWELVADWYRPAMSPNPVTDPTGPETGSHRVHRGGSWGNFLGSPFMGSKYCRSAHRWFPGGNANRGFRVARSE